ncbi:MAG: S41 family peptidase [Kangiellaceae bacterium]|nr:S41 family peptidase [Kangiellaceae bacterium]
MQSTYRLLSSIFVLFWLAGCASIRPDSSEVKPSQVAEPVLTAAATTQISPDLLKEELELIESHLKAIHPEPFGRTSRSDFESHLVGLKNTIIYPQSRAEFYLKIAPLLASLNDVHSFVHLPKDQFGDFHRRGEKLFPLAVILQQEDLYVAADLSSLSSIPTGAQVLTINGVSVSHIISQMRRLAVKETPSGQNRRIQMDFAWLMAALGYGAPEYLTKYEFHGEVYEVTSLGMDVPKAPQSPDKVISYYGYSKLTGNTSLLWLNDFNEDQDKFASYLEDKFALMERQGVSNLILDLRYNSGGLSENLKALLAKITSKPVYWASKGKIKISKHLKSAHRTNTRHRRENKYNWGLQWLPIEWANTLQRKIWWADLGDFVELKLEPVTPSKYKGLERVWVLTNGFCYSACSFFIASVKHYELGRVIGEKPGSIAKYQFAYPVTITLPHSGLRFTLPSMRLDFPETKVGDLILPHLEISRSQEQISQKKDPILAKALREAESSQ